MGADAGCCRQVGHPPKSDPIANTVFAPTGSEIARAIAAVRAVQEAEVAGLGAASFQGVMTDAATARIFNAVLVRARQCGVVGHRRAGIPAAGSP